MIARRCLAKYARIALRLTWTVLIRPERRYSLRRVRTRSYLTLTTGQRVAISVSLHASFLHCVHHADGELRYIKLLEERLNKMEVMLRSVRKTLYSCIVPQTINSY